MYSVMSGDLVSAQAQQLMSICREYILGLSMEVQRKDLPKVIAAAVGRLLSYIKLPLRPIWSSKRGSVRYFDLTFALLNNLLCCCDVVPADGCLLHSL